MHTPTHKKASRHLNLCQAFCLGVLEDSGVLVPVDLGEIVQCDTHVRISIRCWV
jgi:hypothetical protein